MKAMILAAGEGTRLRPLTLNLPKPMVPVANLPLLQRTVALLQEQGISELAVNLYHQSECIRSHFGNTLTYSEESTLLGTAGGVKKVEALFDRTFVVLYGDNLYDFDLAPLVAYHRQHQALATIATFTTDNPTACGLVVTDSLGHITRFQEKPPPSEVFTDQANAGVYVLEPEVLDFIPRNTPYDFSRDVFPTLLLHVPQRLVALPLPGYLRDTGTPDNYRQANWDLLARGELGIAPSAQVAPDARLRGRNVIGAGSRIESGAQLSECILWREVTVGPMAQVQGAILGDRVQIGAGAQVGEGAILGEGVVVAPHAHVAAGARIAPGTHITQL